MSLEVTKTNIPYQGQIIRVLENTMSDGRVFEKAVRSPGTRTIIYDETDDKLLLSKEFRQEINDYDYRLPGGKVRDNITDWDAIKEVPELPNLIVEAAKKEVREECGVDVETISLFTVSTSGGPTVEWTLYYFVSTKFKLLEKQELEAGEEIATEWLSSKDAIEICLSGGMKEGRSVAALLQYFHSKGKI